MPRRAVYKQLLGHPEHISQKIIIMSTTEIQTTPATLTEAVQDFSARFIGGDKKHDLNAEIHYHKVRQDGRTATIEQYHHFDTEFLDTRSTTIHDVRGSEGDYTLENNGFQYAKSKKPANIDFADDEQIKKEHYPAMEEFLKNL